MRLAYTRAVSTSRRDGERRPHRSPRPSARRRRMHIPVTPRGVLAVLGTIGTLIGVVTGVRALTISERAADASEQSNTIAEESLRVAERSLDLSRGVVTEESAIALTVIPTLNQRDFTNEGFAVKTAFRRGIVL